MRIDPQIAASLPANGIAAKVNESLSSNASLVVTAPPGAGKSTLLPLTILEGMGSWTETSGKILLLEPRRIAARQIAERMASIIGEQAGQTVGYRIRFENRTSSGTRIEVLTEGILTRMLADDPTLEGVAAVIFDEFHERSLQSDVALALTRESQGLIRPDLRIVVMSATIDADSICSSLGCPLIESQGRMFPVDVRNLGPGEDEADSSNCADLVSHWVRLAHKENEGDILAFLPGEGEIRKCAEKLDGALGSTRICPLYGMLSGQEQKAAIAPSAPGSRKVVLATPIAETSITIEGVRTVVDSGLCKKLIFDPQTSLSRLETVRISMDMARQRSGRAGRVAEGSCIRLWTKATESRMADCRMPEILDADLSSMVLDIAAWGGTDIAALPWLTPPPASHVAQAIQLLVLLGAVSNEGGSLRITAHGCKLAALPCHPRIAQMLVKAKGNAALAADIAAILEEKDPMPEANSADITLRIAELRRQRSSGKSSGKWRRLSQIAQQYRQMVRAEEDNSDVDAYSAGMLLASAFPERIAQARENGCGHFLLASGETAFADKDDAISAYDWISIACMNQRKGSEGRVFLACPVHSDDLKALATERRTIQWDARKGAVCAQTDLRLGTLVLESKPYSGISREDIVRIICEAAPKEGLSMFDFSEDVGNLQRRVAAVAQWRPKLELPDLCTEAVLRRAGEWLPLFIGKASSAAELKRIDLCQALWSLLSYEQQSAVDKLAPSHIEVPTGSRIHVEYRQGAELPVLRVRLQECFGLEDTPCVNDGRTPVLMELLSPGFKPVQLTQDLRSFWSGTYFEVRKDLRRRYPKHSWPDDPLEAEAVRGTRKPH